MIENAGGWNLEGVSALYTIGAGLVGAAATAAFIMWRRGFYEGGQAATTTAKFKAIDGRFAEMDMQFVEQGRRIEAVRADYAKLATSADVLRVEVDVKRLEGKMDTMTGRIDRFIDRGDHRER